MVKVEAVVIRERIETVIDAVEEATGHVGVTVVEAVGHGRQRGITHEYRGPRVRVALPAEGAADVPRPRRDRRPRCSTRSRTRRAAATSRATGSSGARTSTTSIHNRTGQKLEEVESPVSNKDLLVAASTIWVVVTAVLVMFMQAGFAFLEAGLTRMKNAGHIAGKNVLIFGVCSLVYWAVGFGLAFGDGNGFIGTPGSSRRSTTS